ncbi:transmembrane protein [Citrus sinensis]|nr:transmembrane protein [Citrus sinensis]
MDDLRQKQAPDGKYYEIRLLYIPGAIIAGGLGVLIDVPVISVVALCKSPYMLFKGWHRLFHDLIGREGPFLETICVPLAGLAIILWPLAVVGAVLGSMVTSIFLGAYAGVVVYQESSLWFGLRYIIAALSIYDEYSNDILDMPEGSCFPRPQYRKKADLSRTSTFSRPSSFKDPPSRTSSLRKPIDLKPLELLERLFKECQHHGEIWVSEGLITAKDIEDAKSNSGSQVVSMGLPAYCLLQALLRSAMANSPGILLSDSVTEITSSNRPKDVFFDWFFNPFLIIKEQIKAENLTEAEEDYLSKLVLFCGNIGRLKDLNVSPPESERKRAELGALARRLQGITKSVSRYPTFRRQFGDLVKTLTEDLAKKNCGSESTNVPKTMQKSNSALARFQKSFKRLTSSNNGRYEESQSQSDALRDLEIL